jgi:hypothetical protein
MCVCVRARAMCVCDSQRAWTSVVCASVCVCVCARARVIVRRCITSGCQETPIKKTKNIQTKKPTPPKKRNTRNTHKKKRHNLYQRTVREPKDLSAFRADECVGLLQLPCVCVCLCVCVSLEREKKSR